MSKLHFTENGRAIATLGEEVTTFRRIRKVVHLPGTAAPATLYILARPYPDSTLAPVRQWPADGLHSARPTGIPGLVPGDAGP